MESYIWVAVGGALGTTGRYWLSGLVAQTIGETFPWGTLIINVTGSFVIGFFAALTGPDGRLFVAMKTGRTLAWDAEKQRIANDEEANRLLQRPYRQPWVHPDPKSV